MLVRVMLDRRRCEQQRRGTPLLRMALLRNTSAGRREMIQNHRKKYNPAHDDQDAPRHRQEPLSASGRRAAAQPSPMQGRQVSVPTRC